MTDLQKLRLRREDECFIYYNRRIPNMTVEQERELDDWYYAWLNAPNKYVDDNGAHDIEFYIPEKPGWLK